MNALIVSLCYKGKQNEVKGHGTLKDIEIISNILKNKFKFRDTDIKILKEEQATIKNFSDELSRMISENKKNNFVYFVGHGFSTKNNKTENDTEENDSGIVLWDGYIVDDALCKMIARFKRETKNLFMFAECYSGGAIDLKFNLLESGTAKKIKKIREVKSKSVLISAVDSNQVSWCYPSGTAFAKNFEKVINEYGDDITFFEIMTKLRELCPTQNCSISASFKIDEMDKIIHKKCFTWVKSG